MTDTLTETKQIEGIELAAFGFIRVTGLDFRSWINGEWQIHPIKPTVDMLGTWANNNGFKIIVTERGEVWLGYTYRDFQGHDKFGTLIRRICPKGGDQGYFTAGCVIPTGGEQILTHTLLARMADPEWDPKRQ